MEDRSPKPEAPTLQYATPLECARPATPQPRLDSVCTEDPDDPGGDIFNRASMGAVLFIVLLARIGDFVRNGGDRLFFAYWVFVLVVLIAAAVMAIKEHHRRWRNQERRSNNDQ
jgi:hypothetical protein